MRAANRMLAAIALAVSGIALVVSALCAWLSWNHAIAAQQLAREAARQAKDVAHMRDVTAQVIDAQANVVQGDTKENREVLAVADRSARAAEESARSSAESARAAEESARATRMLAEASQRAYVSVGSMQVLRSDLSAGFPTAVRGEIRNTGKTPAVAVSSCQWLRALAELPADPDYPGIDTIAACDLGPGAVQTSDAAGESFDPHVAQSLRTRELTMFLYGVSRYSDIFGMLRQTRWAFYWNFDKRQFTRCEHHNDMT